MSSANATAGRAELASSSELELLDEANFTVYRESTVRTGGRVIEHDGLTLVIGTHPSSVIVNTILRSGPVSDPKAALEFAHGTYASIGHGVSLMTSRHADGPLAKAAANASWTPVFELIGMILDQPISAGSEPAVAIVSEVDSVGDLAAIRTIEVAGFADNEDERSMIESLFADSRLLNGPNTTTCVATVEIPGNGREAVAAAIVDLAGAGLITWVATLPDHRRRGFGGLVTRAAANRGFELGASAIVLQASPMGLPVYRRLGFRTIGTYTIWAPPAG